MKAVAKYAIGRLIGWAVLGGILLTFLFYSPTALAQDMPDMSDQPATVEESTGSASDLLGKSGKPIMTSIDSQPANPSASRLTDAQFQAIEQRLNETLTALKAAQAADGSAVDVEAIEQRMNDWLHSDNPSDLIKEAIKGELTELLGGNAALENLAKALFKILDQG